MTTQLVLDYSKAILVNSYQRTQNTLLIKAAKKTKKSVFGKGDIENIPYTMI